MTSSSRPAEQYFDLLEQGLRKAEGLIPQMTRSAEEVARRLVNGGSIYAGGPQERFLNEVLGRAGGLLALDRIPAKIKSEDAILLATYNDLTDAEVAQIASWRQKGAYVVVFGSSALRNGTDQIDSVIRYTGPAGLAIGPNGKEGICPVDSVMNVAHMWAWTGELTSACTRLGKMPVLYQSYGIEGGRDRAKKYQGKTFHDDMTIKPIPAGVLAKAYLAEILREVRHFRSTQMEALLKAVRWWREAGEEHAAAVVFGHMFPEHFRDRRAPKKISVVDNRKYPWIKPHLGQDEFVLVCGYQKPPTEIINDAIKQKFRLAYTSVKSAELPADVTNVLYINPCWPLPDSCVPVDGYDVPILPASGVMEAVIYWATLAEACQNGS